MKKVIFENCAPFTNCVRKINNTKIDDAEHIDIVMSMYNVIEYSDICSKTSRNLWQYCKEIPAVNNAGNIADLMELIILIHLTLKPKQLVRLIIMVKYLLK